MTGNREWSWVANIAEDDNHASLLASGILPGDDRPGWDEYYSSSAEFVHLIIEPNAEVSTLDDEALVEEGVMVLCDLGTWSETEYLGDGTLALMHGSTGERARCGYGSSCRVAEAHRSRRNWNRCSIWRRRSTGCTGQRGKKRCNRDGTHEQWFGKGERLRHRSEDSGKTFRSQSTSLRARRRWS
jgi:hypothetical protein